MLRKIGGKIMWFLGEVIPSCTFLVIFCTFCYSIVSRYFFRKAVSWGNEMAILGYMWTMFFGVGKAIENDEHVVFSLVYDMLKPMAQMICKVVYNLALAVLLVLCYVPCFNNLMASSSKTGVLKIPYTWAFAPFMWMLIEIIVRSLINVKKAYTEYKEKTEGGAAK